MKMKFCWFQPTIFFKNTIYYVKYPVTPAEVPEETRLLNIKKTRGFDLSMYIYDIKISTKKWIDNLTTPINEK